MNNLTQSNMPLSTVALSIVAAMAWPAYKQPAYAVKHSSSSYSFFRESLIFSPLSSQTDFAREIANFYAALCEGQEPLGAEFEAVWDANVGSLYES